MLHALSAPFRFLAFLGLIAAFLSPSLAMAQDAKPETNYVLLPRLYLPVPDNQTGAYRMLDVEAWLLFDTPEEAQRISSVKAVIGERMKIRFIEYQWGYFHDPLEGPARVKAVIRKCAEEIIGTSAEIRDVLIKKMVTR